MLGYLKLVALLTGASSMTDLDTPVSMRSTTRFHDGANLTLVMSDEYEINGRSFGPGEDAFFEAIDQPGQNTNKELQYYNSSTEFVTTRNGYLVIVTKRQQTTTTTFDYESYSTISQTYDYTSALIQSWNKFCFTGGVLEISVQLPGQFDSGGLWPALWMMGNLARAAVPQSGYFVWPWSFDKCSNLSSNQKINACFQDPGDGLNPFQGRGSPEIDIIEAMAGYYHYSDVSTIANFSKPYLSTSYQVAPGIPNSPRRPVNGLPLEPWQEWYQGMENGTYFNSEMNSDYYGGACGEPDFGGPQNIYMEDCISLRSELTRTYWEKQHVFRLEWQPGSYLDWYVDNHFVYSIPQEALTNATGSLISLEPMYIVANVALSQYWGFPDGTANPGVNSAQCIVDCFDCLNPECDCNIPEGMKNCHMFPTEMKIDFIRLYQDPHDSLHTLGCSPEGFPTKEFISINNASYSAWSPISAPPLWTYFWAYISRNFTIELYLLFLILFCIVCLFLIIGSVIVLCETNYFKFRRGYSEISEKDFVDVNASGGLVQSVISNL